MLYIKSGTMQKKDSTIMVDFTPKEYDDKILDSEAFKKHLYDFFENNPDKLPEELKQHGFVLDDIRLRRRIEMLARRIKSARDCTVKFTILPSFVRKKLTGSKVLKKKYKPNPYIIG